MYQRWVQSIQTRPPPICHRIVTNQTVVRALRYATTATNTCNDESSQCTARAFIAPQVRSFPRDATRVDLIQVQTRHQHITPSSQVLTLVSTCALTRPRPSPGSQSACSMGPYGSAVAYRSDAETVTTQSEAYGVIYWRLQTEIQIGPAVSKFEF